jgi:predicted nucleotidyltransferase
VKQLANRYRLYGVVFSGSRARGDYKPWSGYDLLVIGAFEEPYLERLAKILGALKDTSLPVEPHPYTLGEALDMLSKGNPHIVSEGVVLFKTPEFEALE